MCIRRNFQLHVFNGKQEWQETGDFSEKLQIVFVFNEDMDGLDYKEWGDGLWSVESKYMLFSVDKIQMIGLLQDIYFEQIPTVSVALTAM